MDEAIARLDLLGLSNQFLLEGQYQISSHQELFLIEDNEIIEMIRQFEKANRSYVYHTIAYDTSEGTYIVCLHVSPQSSHWKEERRQLMKQKAIAFCFLADQLNHNGMFDLSLDEHLEVRKMRPYERLGGNMQDVLHENVQYICRFRSRPVYYTKPGYPLHAVSRIYA